MYYQKGHISGILISCSENENKKTDEKVRESLKELSKTEEIFENRKCRLWDR